MVNYENDYIHNRQSPYEQGLHPFLPTLKRVVDDEDTDKWIFMET